MEKFIKRLFRFFETEEAAKKRRECMYIVLVLREHILADTELQEYLTWRCRCNSDKIAKHLYNLYIFLRD